MVVIVTLVATHINRYDAFMQVRTSLAPFLFLPSSPGYEWNQHLYSFSLSVWVHVR